MTDIETFDTGKYKHTPIHEVTLHEFMKMCEDPNEVITDLQGRIITGPRRIEQSKQVLTQKYLENKAVAKEKGLTVATHEVLADPDWKPEPINIKPNKEQEPMSDDKPVLNKKGKPFTWSFSAINDFDPELGGCPKKYAHARFWCDTPFVETEALRWGNEVHKALELRIKEGTPLPDGMKQWEKYAAALLKAAEGYTIIAEDKIALTRKFGVTGYFDKDAWGRGAADVLVIKDDTAYIYDWKGLALDTKLPTPTGWTTMGEVQEGDEVLGADGKPCKVVGKSQVKNLKCYKITFSDGCTVVCDEEHLWEVSRNTHPKMCREVKPVTELVGVKALNVRMAEPIDLPDVELPVPPYTLGVWLGDGKHTDGSVTNPEIEVFNACKEDGFEYGEPHGQGSKADVCPTRTLYGLRTKLREAGLLGNKHIPEIYFRASIRQRLALLQGIMDSDGYANPVRRQAVLTTVKEDFAKQVEALVTTLGWRPKLFAVIKRGFGKVLTGYDIVFTPYGELNPFKLQRKAAAFDVVNEGRNNRVIKSVEEVPSVPTQCISVDSSDRMYLCGEGMIPTHNTGKPKDNTFQLQVYAAMVALKYPQVQRIIPKFIFLKHDKVLPEKELVITREELKPILVDILNRTKRMEEAWKLNNFPAVTSGLCGWCDARKECSHYEGKR